MPPDLKAIRKLNYLLVMPRLIQKEGDGYSFPLGIAYISASLKKAGFNVFPLNLNHRGPDFGTIVSDAVRRLHIDVVATGGLSFQYTTLRKIFESARLTDPRIITILGGGIVTADPPATMRALECVDYGVIGEGERTICELCAALESGGDPAAVDGLIFRGPGGLVTTKPRKELESIDGLPWPDYEGFELDRYLAASPGISGLNRTNTIFMIASRSCPYNCTFCFHTTGRRYRQRSLDGFFEELDHLVERYHIEYICLADELFSHNTTRAVGFCRRMAKYKVRWWAQFRVNEVTDELLEALKAGGCDVMSFGLESAHDRVLKSMRKGTTVGQMERTLEKVYESGISMEGSFIFGDIAETWETATHTLDWWRRHSQYKINLNLITTFPGSYLYKYACEKGIIADPVQFLRDGCPQVNVSQLDEEQFGRLVRTIIEAPWSQTRMLSKVELGKVDSATGRMDVKGVCTTCEHVNAWERVKLFSSNFLACGECGQRYNIALPDRLRQALEANVSRLLERFGKVAIWGINYHAADLFRRSDILRDRRVFPIDISSMKRKMDLYGQKIWEPAVLEREGIRVVVVSIPVYFSEIAGMIRARHPDVRHVIDVCSLVDERFAVQDTQA